MSIIAHATRRPVVGAVFGTAAASLFAAAGRLVRELRLRRAIRAMQDLDEAMLHDVGLTRDGIEDAVRHGRTARRR
ncbi:MAG TPA: DUF1127 domain-containing protein [Microvirga sp.]|jgi:uncharacterized protein YjiS (DUF1127 family)|nr:DUF1127 domain-containing protein [Microvirga sp.]